MQQIFPAVTWTRIVKKKHSILLLWKIHPKGRGDRIILPYSKSCIFTVLYDAPLTSASTLRNENSPGKSDENRPRSNSSRKRTLRDPKRVGLVADVAMKTRFEIPRFLPNKTAQLRRLIVRAGE